MFGLPLGVNAAFALSGARLDPYYGYNFLVEVDNILVGGFREVHGLEASIDVKEYAEGGENGYLHKLPGPTRYPNLVLSRGFTDIDTMWVWFDNVSRGVIQRQNISILVLDSAGLPGMWWNIRDAMPIKWVGPALDAAATEVATESIELVHRGITKPVASRLTMIAHAATASQSAVGNALGQHPYRQSISGK